ncbi:hypothetical protein N7533_008658 [Penicillium manginii]|uniref:uncharacterized protein n=1 Tax=Penicillium manginii TaxID=203109 RepID=UPI00254877A8|nr:uncharacterized protein N7533_008658 [Penicillium manginii]KAJ5743788.1 hypothetical protein N7533_008658 [Penicillium manginii]
MAAAGTRAQKPVGSAAWIATEKENVAELVEQELEEVEYPVRHEMDWLNEHMAEIFSKGQANFTDVFKTPGKMRGKTPRTARKRNVEDDRVPLSEIFSSSHKQVENKAVSPSPFIHRVISKTAAPAAVAPPRLKEAEAPSQPQYPDLTQNLNSFQKYNTDSGYHGMEDEDEEEIDDDDEMVLPDTQPESETATQPFEVDEPARSTTRSELSVSQRTTENSFVSAQENVRARGETIEPMNVDPTPTQERTSRAVNAAHKESEPELDTTPKVVPPSKTKYQTKASTSQEARSEKPKAQEKPKEQDHEDVISSVKNQKPVATHQPKEEEFESHDDEMEIEDTAKDDTILDDNFDDIGSPSDGSTPDRLPVRKSSLSFASLPAREPLTKKSMGGARISRTSHIDLAKLSHKRNSNFLGVHSSGHKSVQPSSEDNASDPAVDIDDEKKPEKDVDMDQASKLHNKKSTQSLHDRISMLGKPQTRPNKSIPTAAGSAGQIAYPELPATKTGPKLDSSNEKTRKTPAPKTDNVGDDDWIKALDSPQRPNLAKSKTTDVMERLFEPERPKSSYQKMSPALKQKLAEEPERPKSSASIFSSPRPRGHQQSASTSILGTTTPVGSPRRFEGPLSASKIRLQSIMKSAKGLFTSTGSPSRIESSSPVAHRVQTQERMSVDINEHDVQMSEPPHIPSPPARQEGRRTRSSTEKEEKRQRKEEEDRQREAEAHQEELRQEEARLERTKEQEKQQRTAQLKAAQDKSSVEIDERNAQRPSQPQRQQSREPESKYGIPQPKQADRRPKPLTREAVQKPEPRPVSIRVGSTMSTRQIPVATSVSSSFNEANAPAPAPTSKQTSLKKKGSNQSLQTASSTNSLKSSTSSQTQAQRKAQLASERKREQDRKRAAQQQQEESRRQEAQSRAESRAEADRGRRELSAQEESNKAAIERRRQENARRQHGRTGSQQVVNEAPTLQHEKSALQSSQKSDLGGTRPQSRAGPAPNYGRINPPAPNPARPAKRPMNEEASNRPPVKKISNVHSVIGDKWGKGEDEQQHQFQHQPSRPSVRPPMGPPKRVSNMRQPQHSTINQSSMASSSGSSIFKPGQGPPAPPSVPQLNPPAKPSPKYPSGESIHLPEIATDSEDEDDSDSEMFPVPKWAQSKELNDLLVIQDRMEPDSIFGPIAPFSLEETFKADKKIKKFRDRTSSANWSGPDGLTQEEIRKDRAERQRLRLNGGWSFET